MLEECQYNRRFKSNKYIFQLFMLPILKNETTKDKKVLSVFFLSERTRTVRFLSMLAASAGTGMLRVAEKGVAGGPEGRATALISCGG